MGIKRKQKAESFSYTAFDELDGYHPWMDHMPEGFIAYPVRKLRRGSIAYFNFKLAKEMGLIPEAHPEKITPALTEKLINTFSIRIVNEYDQLHNMKIDPKDLKENKYMATRYLQLQHANKKGQTSGDGRCVWNGVIAHKGNLWDVSSRGTGVTALAPGSVEAGRPLKSGNNDFGYGCGLAEIDELYASAIMAELFNNDGINTERMLVIIDLGGGVGIGVRAGKNLLRPAHLFMYLKQQNHDALRRATDYLVIRQHRNREWKFGIHNPLRYKMMLEEICKSYAHFAAHLDREYVFAWLDWDGDNVLANAGIIDYGSVRRFGLRHDEYRYDDVDRFSTNLTEQRSKARLIVQVFAQMVDYLETGDKKPIEKFAKHPILKKFDRHFASHLRTHFLYQLGFSRRMREYLLRNHKTLVNELYQEFSNLERVKTTRKIEKVADGINRPAIFNMRNFVRELPRHLKKHGLQARMSAAELLKIVLAESASSRDARLAVKARSRLLKLQELYCKTLTKVLDQGAFSLSGLRDIAERSQTINRTDRVTGNAILYIVDEILKNKKKGLSSEEIQLAIDTLIGTQALHADILERGELPLTPGRRPSRRLVETFLSLVDDHKEEI